MSQITGQEQIMKDIIKDMVKNHPDNIKVFSIEEWNRSCCSKELQNLTTILKDKKMTLSQIAKEYDDKFEHKSKVTIHRYIKDYIEKGFIIEAGRRIKPNQTASEKLFSLSAHIFLVDNLYSKAWQSEEEIVFSIVERFGVLLNHLFDNKGFDKKKLSEIFLNYENNKIEKAKTLLDDIVTQSLLSDNNEYKKLVDKIFALKEDDALVFFSVFKNILWYLSENNLNNFKESVLHSFRSDIDYDISFDNSPLKSSSDIFKDLYLGDIDDSKEGYALNYNRENLSFINFEYFQKYVMGIKYNAILTILQINEMPLTVKEITDKYSKAYNIVKNKIMCKTTKDKYKDDAEDKSLSENRIYRLLQEFKKDGLIVEAGRKIIEDSNKSFILYTTKGKTFIYLENRDEYWKLQESWDNLAYIMANILRLHFGKNKVDNKKFSELLAELESKKFKSFQKLISSSETKIIKKFMRSLRNIEFNALIDVVGLSSFIKTNEEAIPIKENILNTFN